MDKAKIVKVGVIDELGFPKGWVFDFSEIPNGAAIYFPNPVDISPMRASVDMRSISEVSLDVIYLPQVEVFYGGYTVAELREIMDGTTVIDA